jgi:DNA replication protein DnaC
MTPPEPQPLGDSPAAKALAERLAQRGIAPAPEDAVARTETPEERAERLAQAHAHRRERWLSRVPVMYAQARLEDIRPEDVRGGRFDWPTASLNLVLAGPVGTGKTHAAYAIGNWQVSTGVWVEAFTVVDLLEAMRPDGDARLGDWAKRCQVLVLDDLGAAKASEWAVEQMTALLDTRLREKRRTIVTTNDTWDDLRAAWGARFMDRLAYTLHTIVFTGTSRRQEARW